MKGKSANYKSHYAVGAVARASYDGANLIRTIAYLQIRLLGEGQWGPSAGSASEMFSSEEPSVDGPGAGSNHRQCAAEDREHQRHPKITSTRENNPELDSCDQCSDHGSPQPGQEE